MIAALVVGGVLACNEYITPASESTLPGSGSGGFGGFGGLGGAGGAIDPTRGWEGVGGCIPGTEIRSQLGPACVGCICTQDSPRFSGAPCGPDCWKRLRCESDTECDLSDSRCIEHECGQFPGDFTGLVRPFIAECAAECPEVAGAIDTAHVIDTRLRCRDTLVRYGHEHCAPCACETLTASTNITACDDACWALIACTTRECLSPTQPASFMECIHSRCAEFLGAAPAASTTLPLLRSCGCDAPLSTDPDAGAPND